MARDAKGGIHVTCYLQIVPEYYEGTRPDGTRIVYDARILKMTQRQPTEPLPGAVVVPVDLVVDPAVFGPADRLLARVQPGPGGVRLADM